MTRVAFYAPLKSPRHPTPSGDRTIARLFLAAWRQQGASVELASQLRARITRPDLQQQLARRAQATAERLIAQYRRRRKSDRPQLWFTYHSYYKAVDWIGPRVAAALDIPYLLAEASHAPKRATGDWAFNHRGAEAAIKAARQIFCLNPSDKECLQPVVGRRRLVDLPPFLDLAAFAPEVPDRAKARAALARPPLARRHRLDPAQPWLLAVGMMRPGDKLASYRELAAALARLRRRKWQLLIVGDGAARAEVMAGFAAFGDRVHFLGPRAPEALPEIYAAADLMVWPAVNEAFGMALLEAQACGLPVLAGAVGGVPAIISEGGKDGARTGWLAPPHRPEAFANLLSCALDSDLAAVGTAARRAIERRHDIANAAGVLDASLRKLGIAR
ncbi:MAG TPA: glycosyltransferase family 4 protein [Dongiaceae bacterium]|nr:glycosyltransferase family 4 protein [Dongiaceae bacterium]